MLPLKNYITIRVQQNQAFMLASTKGANPNVIATNHLDDYAIWECQKTGNSYKFINKGNGKAIWVDYMCTMFGTYSTGVYLDDPNKAPERRVIGGHVRRAPGTTVIYITECTFTEGTHDNGFFALRPTGNSGINLNVEGAGGSHHPIKNGMAIILYKWTGTLDNMRFTFYKVAHVT